MKPGFRTGDGPLRLGPSIGKGGEGEVFALADGTPRALKVYADPDRAREAKVRSMVAAKLSLSCPDVAFPGEVAFRSDGKFAGFTMPLVEGCQPIHELYSPTSRRREFPRADWRFLVRTATNVARSFARIHAAGAVIGDVNGSGILVSKRAMVAMIDADSFQWGAHLCRVGVQEFTPPELQRQRLDGVTRTVDHDGFGLAVMIFQLLFLGRHPHAGVPSGREVDLADAIVQHLFAYSRIRTVRMATPPATLLLTDLPLGIRNLFERAFVVPQQRPSASEWIEELVLLETSLISCGRDGRHHRSGPGPCPWCRIERSTNVPAFGTGPRAQAAEPLERRHPDIPIVHRILARARAESGEAATPRGMGDRVHGRTVRDALPPHLGFLRSKDPYIRSYEAARDGLDAALDPWRDRIGAWTVNRSAALLADDARSAQDILRKAALALTRVEDTIRDERVRAELARLPLADAAITGVGRRRLATLKAAGIVAAADVSRSSLERIPGVGEQAIIALILWRDGLRVEVGRRMSIDAATINEASRTIRRKAREEAAAAERRLIRMAEDLEEALDEMAQRASRRDPVVEAAIDAMRRTMAGLGDLDIPTAIIATGAPAGQVAVKAAQATKKPKGPTCPICGGGMVKRWARGGPSPNRFFLGCVSYPRCSGSRPIGR